MRTLLKANARTDIRDLKGHGINTHHCPSNNLYGIDSLFACLGDGTSRQQECFSIIISKRTSDINNGTTLAGKPLLLAACENAIAMEKICLMLLDQGADVNVTDRVKNETPGTSKTVGISLE